MGVGFDASVRVSTSSTGDGLDQRTVASGHNVDQSNHLGQMVTVHHPSPMSFFRWLLRAIRILAGILAIPFGALAIFCLGCAVIAVIMVFARDNPWSSAGVFAAFGGVSALITWGLLAATTPGTRDKLSDLLDILALLHAIGRGIALVFRGVGGLFRVFE